MPMWHVLGRHIPFVCNVGSWIWLTLFFLLFSGKKHALLQPKISSFGILWVWLRTSSSWKFQAPEVSLASPIMHTAITQKIPNRFKFKVAVLALICSEAVFSSRRYVLGDWRRTSSPSSLRDPRGTSAGYVSQWWMTRVTYHSDGWHLPSAHHVLVHAAF